jgi:hypothetical protein
MNPVLASACALTLVDTDLRVDDGRWVEHTRYEIVAGDGCRAITLPLPPDAIALDVQGRVKTWDSTARRLGDDRWISAPRGVDGWGSLTATLPELVDGDRVRIDLQRAWSGEQWTWDPGSASERHLELPLGVEPATDRAPDEPTTFRHPALVPTPAQPSGPPGGDMRRERQLTLLVPAGNPQVVLYPGAGSSVRVDELLTFPPSTVERSAVIPLRAEQPGTVTAQPSALAVVERGPEAALVRIQPSETTVRVAAQWTEPDAPTFGERAPDVDALRVDADGGEIRWERDGWALASMRGVPLLRDNSAAIKAFDNRFQMLANPEPGLPTVLRGRRVDLSLAADLRAALFERARPGLAGEPWWPRRLVKARRSGALTDTEAMLILWVYARQAGLIADWAMARPADEGPGYLTTPAGYHRGLVRIDGGEEPLWIDPSCQVCAPFELPPELEGASVLSPAASTTSAPTPGRSAVRVDDDVVHWTLSGPAALRLRQWIVALPAGDWEQAIAERLAGPGASLRSASGVSAPGATIEIVASRGSGLGLDPLGLPAPDADGAWVDWIGERARSWPAAGDEFHGLELSVGALHYRRAIDGELVTETLRVDDRWVTADALRALDAARRGVQP